MPAQGKASERYGSPYPGNSPAAACLTRQSCRRSHLSEVSLKCGSRSPSSGKNPELETCPGTALRVAPKTVGRDNAYAKRDATLSLNTPVNGVSIKFLFRAWAANLTSAPGRVKYRIAKGIAFHSVTMARGPTNS
jgi:hypothetical protein